MYLIKAGGGKTINWDYIAQDIAKISKKEKVIVMHGASQFRDEVAEKLGIPTKTIISPSGISSVYTDQNAIDVFLMVYAGLVNKKIVATFHKYGVNAVGLSGVDGALWRAKRKQAVYSHENGKTKLITDNLTGRVESVNAELLNILLSKNYVPVLCPPALSFENEIVNTDNDWASAMVASALSIKKVVVLFEEAGLLSNFEDKSSVIHHVDKNKLGEYMSSAQGRMKKKILGAKRAFEMGVSELYWGDGRKVKPVTSALNGKGTIIK